MMKHTFLFFDAEWHAKGKFIDGSGNVTPTQCISRIIHRENVWINDSEMVLIKSDKKTLKNRYEITPFRRGSDHTKWISVNPDLGKLEGTFVVVGDSIISIFQTEDGKFRGNEFLIQVDERKYENRGVLFSGGTRISSWIAELEGHF